MVPGNSDFVPQSNLFVVVYSLLFRVSLQATQADIFQFRNRIKSAEGGTVVTFYTTDLHNDSETTQRDKRTLCELLEQISGDRVLDNAESSVISLLRLTLERAINAELDAHLGYCHSDRRAKNRGGHENSRNGSYSKTLLSSFGSVELQIPRDRHGTFVPRLIPKGKRRLNGLDRVIVSYCAGAITAKDVERVLAKALHHQLSSPTIRRIAMAIQDSVVQWRQRILEDGYPIVIFSPITVVTTERGREQPAHLAVGVNHWGERELLGIWARRRKTPTYWNGVFANIVKSGVQDVAVVFAPADEEVRAVASVFWPHAEVKQIPSSKGDEGSIE